jgi:glutamate N-acetyltransferase/amino-acid N-acetyltransferase
VFTTNAVKAAPVLYDRDVLESGAMIQAVLINSGCANACTGTQGMRDAQRTAQVVEERLGLTPLTTLVMSTGVIGQHLPMGKIVLGVDVAQRSLSDQGGDLAALAIMTTDTRPKEAAVRIQLADQEGTIAGMCKGSGMIHPNMATMLGVLVTDVSIEQSLARRALQTVVDQTFNRVTVDGDTSTNDTVVLLANGQSGMPHIASPDSTEFRLFESGLLEVCTSLARQLARDGEGATKLITVRVTGAHSAAAATRVAKSIANSSLVKTAVYGEDANWGRVLCAAGYSGIEMDPTRLSLWMENQIDSLNLVKNGEPSEIDESRAAVILAQDEVTFRLDLGQGKEETQVWTCDLSHAYVDINAHYRT